MEAQQKLMEGIMKRLEGLEAERRKSEEEEIEREAIQKARAEAHGEEMIKSNQRSWEAMKKKLDKFEEVKASLKFRSAKALIHG